MDSGYFYRSNIEVEYLPFRRAVYSSILTSQHGNERKTFRWTELWALMSRGVKARVPRSSWQKKRAKTVSDRSIYPDYRLPRHRLKWPQVLARIPYTARTEKKKKRKRKKEKKEKEGTDIYIRTMRGERCRTSMRCNVWLSHSFAGYDFFNTWSVPARVCRRKAKLRTSKIRDRPLASIQALHIIIGRYYPTEARACPLGSRLVKRLSVHTKSRARPTLYGVALSFGSAI